MTPKKTDTNQADIVKTLRSLGVFVFSLHEVGRGCPDLLCSYRGKWWPAEIKNGKLGKLTDSQKDFHEECGAPIAILTCPDDAIAWVRSLQKKTPEPTEQVREALQELAEQAQKARMGY